MMDRALQTQVPSLCSFLAPPHAHTQAVHTPALPGSASSGHAPHAVTEYSAQMAASTHGLSARANQWLDTLGLVCCPTADSGNHGLLAQLLGYPASLPCAVPINLPPAVQAQLLSLAQLGALLQQLPQQHPPLPNQQLQAAQAGGAHNVTPMEEAPLLEGISAKYPSYVTQVITREANMLGLLLLEKLRAMQVDATRLANQYQTTPTKWYQCSLKEAYKKLSHTKLLLVAPDIMECQGSTINPMPLVRSLLMRSQWLRVPVVFVLSRRRIGQVFGPNKNTSVVAVTNFQGCEREAAQLLELAHQGAEVHKMYVSSR